LTKGRGGKGKVNCGDPEAGENGRPGTESKRGGEREGSKKKAPARTQLKKNGGRGMNFRGPKVGHRPRKKWIAPKKPKKREGGRKKENIFPRKTRENGVP